MAVPYINPVHPVDILEDLARLEADKLSVSADGKAIILNDSAEGSTKKYKITVNAGTVSADEVV